MKFNVKAAIAAGVVGTIAFDLVGLLLTGTWWDIPNLLGAKLGVGIYAGVLAHYANGVVLAVLFVALADKIPGPRWSRAFTFITAHTIFGVWLFMLPLLDMGIAGLGVSAMIPIITMARHWAYAGAMTLTLQALSARSADFTNSAPINA